MGGSPARKSASVTKISPAPATTDWSSSSAASGVGLRAIRAYARSGSASARNGSGPRRSRSAATSGGVSSSQAVGPRRSSQCRSLASRSRTWPTGSGGSPPVGELAVQPEVYVQRQLAGVVVQQVLAVRLGALQHGPGEPGGALGEAALRAGGVQLVPGEQLGVPGRQAMDRVSLWHRCQG